MPLTTGRMLVASCRFRGIVLQNSAVGEMGSPRNQSESRGLANF